MHLCISRNEINTRWLPQSLSTLSFETGFLTEPRAHQLALLACQHLEICLTPNHAPSTKVTDVRFHAFAVNTLPTEPFPQPWTFYVLGRVVLYMWMSVHIGVWRSSSGMLFTCFETRFFICLKFTNKAKLLSLWASGIHLSPPLVLGLQEHITVSYFYMGFRHSNTRFSHLEGKCFTKWAIFLAPEQVT